MGPRRPAPHRSAADFGASLPPGPEPARKAPPGLASAVPGDGKPALVAASEAQPSDRAQPAASQASRSGSATKASTEPPAEARSGAVEPAGPVPAAPATDEIAPGEPAPAEWALLVAPHEGSPPAPRPTESGGAWCPSPDGASVSSDLTPAGTAPVPPRDEAPQGPVQAADGASETPPVDRRRPAAGAGSVPALEPELPPVGDGAAPLSPGPGPARNAGLGTPRRPGLALGATAVPAGPIGPGPDKALPPAPAELGGTPPPIPSPVAAAGADLAAPLAAVAPGIAEEAPSGRDSRPVEGLSGPAVQEPRSTGIAPEPGRPRASLVPNGPGPAGFEAGTREGRPSPGESTAEPSGPRALEFAATAADTPDPLATPGSALPGGSSPTASLHRAAPAYLPGSRPPVVPEVRLAAVPLEIGLKSLAGVSRFEMRLDPPELGRVDVRLDIDGEGGVTARLVVERADTLLLLQRDAPALRAALEQAGFTPTEGGLDLRLGSGAGQGPQQGHDGRGPLSPNGPPVRPGERSLALEPPSGPPSRPRGGGIDLTV